MSLPLENNLNYGVIGNCLSAALVSPKGSIEWCCLPNFDSPSFFAKLLDKEIGGEFGILVPDGYKISQSYLPRTNMIQTRFEKGPDRFEIIDFMPRYKKESGEYHPPPDIIRYIRYRSGTPKIRVRYTPRPCFGQYDVKTEIRNEFLKTGTLKGSYESVYLYSDINLAAISNEKEILIEKDCYLLLSYNQKLTDLNLDFIDLEFEKTKVYWLNWVAKTQRFAAYNDEIIRSALILKLLAYEKSGAILAAITTSLPEEIGGERNWDYRYCWIRDASMIISVLTRLGHYRVARRFLSFILNIIPYKDENIQIMYGINGQRNLEEKNLSFLSGYENSKPVRIGNAAYNQKQNDIFGVLLDVIHQYIMIFSRETIEEREDLWTVVRTLARHVEHQWKAKDRSIWELRTTLKHFTFSKVLSWVAMDRALKIAEFFSMEKYVTVWAKIRDEIKKDIMAKGWNPKLNAFTQSYDSEYMDASNLLMEHYGFISASDPKYRGTVKCIKEKLCVDGLVYRYRNSDDFGVPNSAFTVCTFWLIKSLYKIGDKESAYQLFDHVLSFRNHMGLLSEDIDFKTKRLLGNFPQGYSHLALIDTAITLSETK